ncbi:hypothetical protein NUACC21_60010 [Scytonema sp. NUACC21]
MKKILILSANPTDTTKLRLDEEVREIQAGLERAKKREQFEIICKWAVRPDDLRRALLDHEPHIVHFSCHGTGTDGIAIEDNSGETQLVSTDALARLFKLFKGKIECVLLNACYSEVQAKAIYQHVDYVVGMSLALGDRAAIEFVIGFYDALGAGRTIEDAYEFGCTSIDLEGISESSTPVLKTRRKTRAVSVSNKKVPQDNLSGQETDTRGYQKSSTKVTPGVSLEEPQGGQVPLESAFYVERPPIEADCYETILRPGALIRIKAPRQMGKSSLMTRILHYATEQGYRALSLNFQEADTEFFSDTDQFLQWFCASITDRLNLPDKLEDYWKGILGSKNKCTKYFQGYLLSAFNSPIVLGLDEVDEVFKHPQIAADFFGLLRSWHERSKNEPTWKQLRLIIVHSKEVYIPLNINQSPFNVGLPIELAALTQTQVQDLMNRHGLNWTAQEIAQLMQLVGGHPYLVRIGLYQIARNRMALEKLQQVAPTEEGPYSDHLRRHLLNLQEDEQLLQAAKQVFAANDSVNIGTTEAFKLRSMGVVKFHGNEVIPLCDLYQKYFCDRLRLKT